MCTLSVHACGHLIVRVSLVAALYNIVDAVHQNLTPSHCLTILLETTALCIKCS